MSEASGLKLRNMRREKQCKQHFENKIQNQTMRKDYDYEKEYSKDYQADRF